METKDTTGQAVELMKPRVIKFRAWDGNRMIFDITQWYVNEADGGYHLCDGHFLKSLMQFTGLQDKNGKDIYEGDIVKHLTNNEKWEPLNDDSPIEIEVNSVVEWSGHGFWLSKEYFGYEGEGLANWEQLEIIGNIYEHPHLLPIEQNDDKQNNL